MLERLRSEVLDCVVRTDGAGTGGRRGELEHCGLMVFAFRFATRTNDRRVKDIRWSFMDDN